MRTGQAPAPACAGQKPPRAAESIQEAAKPRRESGAIAHGSPDHHAVNATLGQDSLIAADQCDAPAAAGKQVEPGPSTNGEFRLTAAELRNGLVVEPHMVDPHFRTSPQPCSAGEGHAEIEADVEVPGAEAHGFGEGI